MAISDIIPKPQKTKNIKGSLKWAALFLGELRDGLTMINMQSAFLIVAKGYTEKQVGILFFTFGMSQFLFQGPAGYLFDYTENKLVWLSMAGVLTTTLTVLTAFFASDDNFMLMVAIKFIQGGVTAFIPPGLNSITQGIVGAVGMTAQVAVNEMMNHLGTAIIVAGGSMIAFFLYPEIGALFIVSPIACVGFLWFLNQIRSEDIDHDAARGLKAKANSSNSKQETLVSGNKDSYVAPGAKKQTSDQPSYNFGWNASTDASANEGEKKADTPLQVLRDPILILFIVVCFLFHVSNGTILPLVMQTLAIGNGRSGILLSGMCITIAQLFMVGSAKICGTYSQKYGRKWLFMIGLAIVPIRCAILGGLLTLKGDADAPLWLQGAILATQILDGVGAGTFGTMYILVTSDIAGGSGRFGMTLGLTTAAMSIGGTVSGYMGQALAQDRGYLSAFWILMFMSMIPALIYLTCMPETLPDHSKEDVQGITSIQEVDEDETSDAPPIKPVTPAANYIEMV